LEVFSRTCHRAVQAEGFPGKNAGIAVKGLLPDLQTTFTARRVSTRDSRRRDSAIVPLSVPLHCVPTDPVRRFVVDITPLGMLC
jgi:hypothetical protein